MLESILNPYDRKARLYPALLAIAVPVIAALIITPAYSDQIVNLASIAVALGFLMLLSSLGRERGRRIEPCLFKKWGGTPTTQLLLRSTSSLDNLTLERYRQFLETRISGLRFLDAEVESANLKSAVEVCESSVKWLREKTRDTKMFPLIFSENTNYGFRRNLLGVKPIALVLSIVSLLAVSCYAWIGSGGDVLKVSVQSWLAGAVSFVGLFFWIFVVTPGFVRTTAFAYATALLAACDSPHFVLVQQEAKIE
ncbi:MAG: hypothetical protein FWG26_08720 [Betaproteobacteria bacterium]|nr:hypothetical protein [Betaproteobacteria bacterium]